jgi:hypothetical protein
MKALSAITGIIAFGLVDMKVGGVEAGGGTWIHPEARWNSAIFVSGWCGATSRNANDNFYQ